ncbi:MAG TPA: MarR family transcriptional regulator [Bryobacteraceae bacterium]|nr:MarR family transcriptional regulator [Bryobacteraceae bacterium]
MRAIARTNRSARKDELAEEIVGQLVRRFSTAAVLFHHAIAERLGLGPTDHKCLDLLRERAPITGSELAAITGLTTGAITGVVSRLERAGYVRRELDPDDGRQQLLYPARKRVQELQEVINPLRNDVAGLLDGLDAHQLTAIASFLRGTTDFVYRHAALLRTQTLYAPKE